jgi:hypothetical protein
MWNLLARGDFNESRTDAVLSFRDCDMKWMIMAAMAASCMGVATHSALAMTETECSAAWSAADKNRDGVISMDEGARYYAALRVADKRYEEGKLSQTDFMTNCRAGVFDRRQLDAGAPLKGANSFTEGQARDRATSHGFTNIERLTKDADGIWRGTAHLEGKPVQVSIDYKGNVVGH